MIRKFLKHSLVDKYLFLLPAAIIFTFPAFSQPHGKVRIPKSFVLGTSDILITDFSVSALKNIRKSGINDIEITWYKFIQASPEERMKHARVVSKNAKEAEMVIWSTHLPYGSAFDISEPNESKRTDVVNKVKEYINLGLVMGAKQMVIHPSFEPIPENKREDHIKACRKSLNELSAYIKGKPIELNVEDLPRTCLGNTNGELLKIIDGIPEIGICFDANHLLWEKPEEFIHAVGSKIRMVHISDYDGIDEKHWLPGRGINNWNKIISALIEVKYKGPFIYEVVKRKDDTFTLEDLKTNYDRLIKSWKDAL